MPTFSPSSSPTPFRTDRLLHGGDYNPEQWEHVDGIWDDDIRLMGEAACNVVSLGIFSWARLEPEEGRYDTAWLDDIMARLHRGGVAVFLATPSGAKPNWLSLRYPEVRRVNAQGRRDPQQGRHNHCPSSPVYREKVRAINTMLAERYGAHPAVKLWHLSNEYGGECYCDLCFANFRSWLQDRYGDIETLNRAWWSRFWSHTYADFAEITCIDTSVHGLHLDWRRFTTHQCIDFMRAEIAPLKRIAPQIPVTTNFMGTYPGLDYWRFVDDLDVVSWDLYPAWGVGSDADTACAVGFTDEMYRCMKGGRPWLQMEAVTSAVNWQPTPRPKRPGMHALSSWHSVAYGADSVCYFQWRKSRGSSEKFHGAVVDHVGHGETRVFREVATLGRELGGAAAIAGSTTPTQVTILYDWVNRWAIEAAQGPRNRDQAYEATCQAHYRPFWKRGIPADVVDGDQPLNNAKLVVAPMAYLLKPGQAQRYRDFVAAGGTLVMTYLSAVVDEHDLVHLGGWPGAGLREVFGIWVEEHDCLVDSDHQTIVAGTNQLGLNGSYDVRHYAEVVHAEGAEVLATFGEDFYAGQPAVTRHRFGKGEAIYVAGRADERLLDDLLGGLADQLDLHRALPEIPTGVCVRERETADERFLFVLNFANAPTTVSIGPGWTSLLDGAAVSPVIELAVHGYQVLRRRR
jgi:beta-galactosidase